MARTLLYTALFGRHRVAYAPHPSDRYADCICFSDRPARALDAPGWTVRQIAPWAGAMPTIKVLKCLPHLLGDYERSCLMDANLRPRRSLLALFDRLDGAEMGVIAHNKRRTTQDEYRHCLHVHNDAPGRLDSTAARVLQSNYPLYLGGLLWRRHTPRVADFGQRWLMEIFLGTRRDQISLPWALAQAQVPVRVFPRGESSKLVMIHRHR